MYTLIRNPSGPDEEARLIGGKLAAYLSLLRRFELGVPARLYNNEFEEIGSVKFDERKRKVNLLLINYIQSTD